MNVCLCRNVRTLVLASSLRRPLEFTRDYSTRIFQQLSLPNIQNTVNTERLDRIKHISQKSSSEQHQKEVMADIDTKLVASHDEKKKEFYIGLSGDSNSAKAVLQYELVGSDCMDMYHTGVPVEFRGKGVAKILAKAAMDYAVEKNMKMMLTCSYLQKYVQDNPLPQYTERVVQSS